MSYEAFIVKDVAEGLGKLNSLRYKAQFLIRGSSAGLVELHQFLSHDGLFYVIIEASPQLKGEYPDWDWVDSSFV